MKKLTAALLILTLLAGCAAPVVESPAPTAEPMSIPTEEAAPAPTQAATPSPTATLTPAPTPTPEVAVFPAPKPTTEVIRPLTEEEIDRVNAAFAQGVKASGLWRNWSYYVRHNQYEAPDGFVCADGTALSHTIVLKSGVDPDTGYYRQISLCWAEEDGWYIYSVSDRAAELPELTEGELTKEEIARLNAIFGWSGENYDIAAAQLFANHYADITEMNLGDALYYYPDDGCVEFVDTAELDALRGHVKNLDEIMYIVPCHRILRSSVDETLRRFAGVTAAELKTMADAIYVPEYDAFYNFSSDFGPGYFTCEGGRVEGDTATLWGKSGSSISFQESGEGVRDVVTLKREDGAWHIKSHVKEAVDPDASLEAFLLALTGEDIAEISGGEALEKEAVAELIYAGCQNMPWNVDYRWAEIPPEVLKTLALTLRSGEKVTLEALADGKTVRVMGPERPDAPVYLCDQELYELVKESPQPTAAPTPSPTAEPTPTPDRRDLTEEQVGQVNRAFSAQENPEFDADFMAVSGFFTSYYDNVRELDFVEFLWYYPSEYGVGEEEFAALTELPGFYWGKEYFAENGRPLIPQSLPVPTCRILRSSVDETLKKYAGITTAELKNTGGVLYVPEYDAYYTFTSDFGPGSFTCVGGRVEGDVAVLWSEERDIHGNRDMLTLQKEGESWYIQSFLLATVPQNG